MDLTLLARERVGKVLRGKYHLDRLIDVGGMAAVYEATHRNGTRSAIKVLHPKYVSDVQARTRFLREGYAANHVGHPGSVTVLDDDFTEEGDVYLVMELLDGESLEGCIAREKTMTEIDVLSIADQLLDVLNSAHHKDIIHRDIKPANIMLTRSGIVKLLDFGLARVRELPAVAGVHSAEIVFGTVAYVSPEAARANNDEMDGRADLWAVAATMFKALAGETVHGMDGSVMERLIRAAKNQARSLGEVVPHLHPRVVDVVDRALMFNRDDRWPSAAVMQAICQDVLAQLMEERGSPPSIFFMPGLSHDAIGYTAAGPMSSSSATASPTPRPYRTNLATPSPSPYPGPHGHGHGHGGHSSHNPLNQIRGRSSGHVQQQPDPRYTPNYANPLNQVASRPRPQQVQPQVQRTYSPLNQVATPVTQHQRSAGVPQNRAPAQVRRQPAVPPSASDSFDIDVEDFVEDVVDDVAVTVDARREVPVAKPRRVTTMRDLGSAAARARAMLDSRRRGVVGPTQQPVAPQPVAAPEPVAPAADDFEIDIGFDEEPMELVEPEEVLPLHLSDAPRESSVYDDVDVEMDLPSHPVQAPALPEIEVDTVRRPPPELPSEETVRRPAPTRPSTIKAEDSASNMDSGIIIEELEDEGWEDSDPWGSGASGAEVDDAPAELEEEVSPEAEGLVSGLLSLPPIPSSYSGAGRLGNNEERVAAAARRREAAAAERAAASLERKAAMTARRESAAAERKRAAERRDALRRRATSRSEAPPAPEVSPPTPTGGGTARLEGLRRRRKASAPVVVDRDRPTQTSGDRTVRVAIPTPNTLPDLGVGQRTPRPPVVRGPKKPDEEEVAELSDSMFIRVPEAAKPGPPAPPRTPVPPLPRRAKPEDDKGKKILRMPPLRKPRSDK